MILYLLDVCLRSVQQWFNATEVGVANGAATLSANGTLLTLAIDCEQVGGGGTERAEGGGEGS